MIIHLLDQLNELKIILASASPRRSQILNQIGLKFKVVSSSFDESILSKTSFPNPWTFVMENAKQKAKHVKEKGDLIISADTIVCFDDKILEKPIDEQDAQKMLETLSDRTHSVYTGVCLIFNGEHEITFFEETKVQFSKLSKELIQAYIKTGEPLDKAGSYGIQGIGGSFVKSIQGCYFNVMGFPLHKFCEKLSENSKLLIK